MKYFKLSEFEIYLLQESLSHYKHLFAKEENFNISVGISEYLERVLDQLEEKLNEKSIY